jgi:hypothetical protein
VFLTSSGLQVEESAVVVTLSKKTKTTTVAAPQASTKLTWTALPEDVQINSMEIVLQLLTQRTNFPNSPSTSPLSLLSKVSKDFRKVVSTIINLKSESSVPPLEIAAIKTKAITTDLGFVHPQFLKHIKRRFNEEQGEGYPEIVDGCIEMMGELCGSELMLGTSDIFQGVVEAFFDSSEQALCSQVSHMTSLSLTCNETFPCR